MSKKALGKKIKKIFAVIASAVIMTTSVVIPLGAAEVTEATATVPYKTVTVDPTTHEVTMGNGSTECTMISSSSTGATWSEGWYAVDGSVTIDGNVTATGNINLILMDGSELTITSTASLKGAINYTDTGNLTVYGQQNQTGKMNVTGSLGIAKDTEAVGNITINGGDVSVHANSNNASNIRASKVIINAGKLLCFTSYNYPSTSSGVIADVEINGGEAELKGSPNYDNRGVSGRVDAYGGKLSAISGRSDKPGVSGVITLDTDMAAYESANPITDIEANGVTTIDSGSKASKQYVLIKNQSANDDEGGGSGGGEEGGGGSGGSESTPVSANLAVVKGKQDITSLYKTFGESGYKYRFKIDNKSERKIFKVSRKGDLKAKKEGNATVALYRKAKKGQWAKVEEHIFKSELPEFEKKVTMNAGETLEASKYTKKAISVSPNNISQKTNIATVDKTTGKITAVKKGRTKIIASYGSGKGAAKYVIRVKVN